MLRLKLRVVGQRRNDGLRGNGRSLGFSSERFGVLRVRLHVGWGCGGVFEFLEWQPPMVRLRLLGEHRRSRGRGDGRLKVVGLQLHVGRGGLGVVCLCAGNHVLSKRDNFFPLAEAMEERAVVVRAVS